MFRFYNRPALRERGCFQHLLNLLYLVFLAQGILAESIFDEGRITISPSDRVMVLAPHPDDEVLGCGGVLQKTVSLNCPVSIVFFTHGDANERSFLVYRKHPVIEASSVRKLAMIRSHEAIAACRVLGVSSDSISFLGYPDGGTLEIWGRHWGTNGPYLSNLSKASSVPYTNAYHFAAPYIGESVIRDLSKLVEAFKPTKIFVSHPGDQHPDHRSLPLFLMVALWGLKASDTQPDVFMYLVHYKHWPSPRGHHPNAELSPPKSLMINELWNRFTLPESVVQTNYIALHAHNTQFEYSGFYLASFIRRNELFNPFRLRPVYLDSPESSQLASQPVDDAQTPPDFLLAQEKVAFVGIEKLFVAVTRREIEFQVALSRPLPKETAILISCFGWRENVAFRIMPKIEVKISNRTAELIDGGRKLPSHELNVERSPGRVKLKLPLSIFDFPDRAFISASTLLSETTLDSTPWQVVQLAAKPSAKP
ncbi:MAG: PIG-L deacetylase family protein [Verrucomicrobiota bacterium]